MGAACVCGAGHVATPWRMAHIASGRGGGGAHPRRQRIPFGVSVHGETNKANHTTDSSMPECAKGSKGTNAVIMLTGVMALIIVVCMLMHRQMLVPILI